MQKNFLLDSEYNAKSYSCSLVIYDETNDMNEISKILALPNSKITKKGTPFALGKKTLHYFYEYEIEATTNIDMLLKEFLSPLEQHIKFLQSIISKCKKMYIRLFVQSSKTKFSFAIPADVVKKLDSIGIGLEISILGWAMESTKESDQELADLRVRLENDEKEVCTEVTCFLAGDSNDETKQLIFLNQEIPNSFEELLYKLNSDERIQKTSGGQIEFQIKSIMAQLGFNLSPEIIRKLSNFNFGINVSILSGGEVSKE